MPSLCPGEAGWRVIHSFIPQILIPWLLNSRRCSRPWGHTSKQERLGSCPREAQLSSLGSVHWVHWVHWVKVLSREGIYVYSYAWLGASLVAQMVKNLPATQEMWVWFLGEGKGNSLQYSCLENPHGQRSLAAYSPWGLRVWHDWATNSHFSWLTCLDVWQKPTQHCTGYILQLNKFYKKELSSFFH